MEFQNAREILEICARLHSRNMLAAADGNVSVRVSDQRILITPSGINKAFAKPSDVATIALDGKVLTGNPSSERLMHLEVYRACPQARAVVHAHPPAAIAWSIAYPDLRELPSQCLSEVILAVGRIPIIPYARPTTQDMGTQLRPFLPDCRVMILSRHGALSWGETLQEAYDGMERVEHSAQILLHAYTLGGLTSLPATEVDELRRLRSSLGERTL